MQTSLNIGLYLKYSLKLAYLKRWTVFFDYIVHFVINIHIPIDITTKKAMQIRKQRANIMFRLLKRTDAERERDGIRFGLLN